VFILEDPEEEETSEQDPEVADLLLDSEEAEADLDQDLEAEIEVEQDSEEEPDSEEDLEEDIEQDLEAVLEDLIEVDSEEDINNKENLIITKEDIKINLVPEKYVSIKFKIDHSKFD
jgi:fused signal recognition particle receptor